MRLSHLEFTEPQLAKIRADNDKFRRSITAEEMYWTTTDVMFVNIEVQKKVIDIIRNYEIFKEPDGNSIQRNHGWFEIQGKRKYFSIGHFSRVQPEPDLLPRYDLEKVEQNMSVGDWFSPEEWNEVWDDEE